MFAGDDVKFGLLVYIAHKYCEVRCGHDDDYA